MREDFPVDLPGALTSHVDTLFGQVGNQHETTEVVSALIRDLEHAVPSTVGLQLVLVERGHPITLTVFDPTTRLTEIGTSLRLSLAALHVPRADPASAITFYARNPGAFVDLAADLAHALGVGVSAAVDTVRSSGGTHPAIVLDEPVQPTSTYTGLVGAAELSTINRAIGILIGDGFEPNDAEAELARRAGEAGVTVSDVATRLVRPRRAR